MKFVVAMWIEGNGAPEDDSQIIKEVEADNPELALEAARSKVRSENPEINHMKIWFWTVRRLYV